MLQRRRQRDAEHLVQRLRRDEHHLAAHFLGQLVEALRVIMVLKACRGDGKLLDLPDALCTKDLSYASDPKFLFDTRRKVAEAIEKLGR